MTPFNFPKKVKIFITLLNIPLKNFKDVRFQLQGIFSTCWTSMGGVSKPSKQDQLYAPFWGRHYTWEDKCKWGGTKIKDFDCQLGPVLPSEEGPWRPMLRLCRCVCWNCIQVGKQAISSCSMGWSPLADTAFDVLRFVKIVCCAF